MTRNVCMAILVLLCSIGTGPAWAQTTERDLSYGADPKQRLDLSTPSGKGFPTVIVVHGGSLTSGDKGDDDYREVCAPFPAAGIACASINYRLAPASAWPNQVEDVVEALVWVRTHIASRGGDSRSLFLVGHSSGGALVALVGADARFLARRGLRSSDVRGIVSIGSVLWDDELEQALKQYDRYRVEEAFRRDPANAMYESLDAYLDHWPIRHVRAGMPPYLFLIAEGEVDQPPVLKTNKAFVERALALGNRAQFRVLQGRTHDSVIRQLAQPGDEVFGLIRGFVRDLGGVAPR